MDGAHRRRVREFLAREPFLKRNIGDEEMDMFCRALTHDSYVNESGGGSYERLEFLGDAVIELIACEHIYRSTDADEGNMTVMKQDVVANRKMSSRILRYGMDMDSVVLVGHGHVDRITKAPILEDNMRADSFEALMGAFYLVYGMEECRRIVHAVLL